MGRERSACSGESAPNVVAAPWDSAAKPGGESATVLVTIIDNVEVRLISFGHPSTQPDGTSSTVEALTVGELAELAESLEPLE